MSDNGTEITSPVGRIVWGDPTKPRQKTDTQTRQPVMNADGTPKMQTSFGVAFSKAEFQTYIWPAMAAEAAKGYPQGQPANFSWKYTDGDTVDAQGKPYNQREGYAGCYVLAVSTELTPPGIFKWENGQYRQMQPNEIKCGDFVRLGLNFKVNIPRERTHTPGLYVNPVALEFIGYGQEIQTGFQADPNALFGGQPVALPPGASATPIGGPQAAQMPGMGNGAPAATGYPAAGSPAYGNQPQGQPMMQPQGQPMMQPQGQPGQMPPPATDFIPGAPQQPMQGQMPGMPGPR